jgi:hypothetical protein
VPGTFLDLLVTTTREDKEDEGDRTYALCTKSTLTCLINGLDLNTSQVIVLTSSAELYSKSLIAEEAQEALGCINGKFWEEVNVFTRHC